MKDRVGGIVCAGGELRDLVFKVVGDHTGEQRQQHQAIAEGKQREERRKGDGFPFGSLPQGTRGKQKGGKRPQIGRGQKGHGQTAHGAAHAGSRPS